MRELTQSQGSTNCPHGDERSGNVYAEIFACTKLRARKSIKTPLSTMLFKVLSYFCVRKQIIFGTIRSDIYNLFQLKSCC